MRAAIYARVSSQAQREAHTIENQLRVLPAFVESQGWSLVDTYTDDGRSAKAGKLEAREGFARLVRDADARKFDILVVVDIDRLTRTNDLEERARILGPFQRNNIQIVTPSGGVLDLRTMFGELWVTMQALAAAEENRKRGERIMAGKLRAIANGRKPAGPTPYGLAYSKVTGWSINARTGPIVREMFRRVIGGESCLTIANDFDLRGLPLTRGIWTRHTVWRIVRSRHSIGEWVADKGRGLRMPVPAIIDESTWQAAQDTLIAHGKRGLRRTKHVYLLEGLAVCGICGAPIAIRSPTKQRRDRIQPAAYVCRDRKLFRRGRERCTSEVARVADVDARVWAAIAAELDDPALASAVQRRAAERAANQRNWTEDIAGFRAHLARLTKVESTLLGRFRRGTVTEQGLDGELAALGRERTALTAQIKAAERAAAACGDGPAADPGAWLAAIRELAATASPEDRLRVVRAILDRPAVLVGQRVKMTLLIEASSESRAANTAVLVVASDYRSHHEKPLKIRLVA